MAWYSNDFLKPANAALCGERAQRVIPTTGRVVSM